jgi:hypothetical protein
VLTVIEEVVAPLLHAYELPVAAVSITLLPSQKAVGPLAEMVAVGNGFTVTLVAGEVLLHPLVTTVTLYVPVVLTVIDCVVAPLLHV